jgi:hypothetical protein
MFFSASSSCPLFIFLLFCIHFFLLPFFFFFSIFVMFFLLFIFLIIYFLNLLNYLVATAMDYGLDGRGSIPGNANLSFTSSRPVLGSTQLSIQRVVGGGLKRPGRKLNTYLHLAPRSRMVELYLHSPIRLHGMILK